MSSDIKPSFPVLEVASFIDATTVVLVGEHVDELEEGEELWILAVGNSTIPKAGVPLVVHKAKLEVTFPAGLYALARTPERTVTMPGPFATMGTLGSILAQATTTTTRARLTNDESQFTGSPAMKPVSVGDPVVRTGDVAKYIRWLAQIDRPPLPTETK